VLTVEAYLTHRADPRYSGRALAAIDLERYLGRSLSSGQRELLYQMAMGYTQGELAWMHGVSLRTMVRRVRELREALPLELLVALPRTGDRGLCKIPNICLTKCLDS